MYVLYSAPAMARSQYVRWSYQLEGVGAVAVKVVSGRDEEEGGVISVLLLLHPSNEG